MMEEYLDNAVDLKRCTASGQFSSKTRVMRCNAVPCGKAIGMMAARVPLWSTQPEQAKLREQAKANHLMQTLKLQINSWLGIPDGREIPSIY